MRDIAVHYHRSLGLPGLEAGLPFALRAAEHAEQAGAHAQASELLRIALDLSSELERVPILRRLGDALAWSLAFDDAVTVMISVADRLGVDAAGSYLAASATTLLSAGGVQQAWEIARRGLPLMGDRHDDAWAVLALTDLERRESEDLDNPGVMLDVPERREAARVLQESGDLDGQIEATMQLRTSLCSTRADAMAMAPAEPLQMWAYTGEYRRARPLFRRRAEECRVRGHVPLQAINLAFEASCLVTLGEIRAGAEVLGDALRLLDSIVDAPRYATIVRRPQYELALAREEGWDSMLALGMEAARAPDPANNWVRAATFSSGARVLAALGHHDLALGCIAETVPALNRAPAWATHFTSVPCDDADALWVLGRPDHADAVERALRETVLPADFRWPMTDARRGLAQLCSLTHRYDEAVMWFQAARETLEQQASRTLRAIIDYDEALMYARRRQSGDRNRACALLDAALRQFEALEMPGWRTKAQALEREML